MVIQYLEDPNKKILFFVFIGFGMDIFNYCNFHFQYLIFCNGVDLISQI
jgi:hypothetical protein